MQSEKGSYINSVSDLYGTDEIEVLLEEIRDLEPANCRPEDIQDFEIAGSQTGVAAIAECESPVGTVRSWDSHANYRHDLPGSSQNLSLFSGVILYCDETHLKSSTGVIRVLLVISSVACLACLCTSGTMKVGLFMLPLVGRLRLMMFVTVFSLLVTCLLIFLDISHIVYLFPFNWGKVNAVVYVSVSVLYLVGSSLLVHLIHEYHVTYAWVPRWSKEQLIVTGVLGYACALEALALSLMSNCTAPQYRPVNEDPSSMTLRERDPVTPLPSPQLAGRRPQQWPAAPPAAPYDDVQPCSSKYPDPYAVA